MKEIASIISSAHSAALVRPMADARPKGNATPEQELAATFLQVLMEEALPKGKLAFGSGIAGSVVRTQLGQQLSRALATSGQIGFDTRSGSAS